jgi:hypothetical protein
VWRLEPEALLRQYHEVGGRSSDASTAQDMLGHLQGVLRAGQRDGEFREFDTFVIAATIQCALGELPFLLQTRPYFDLIPTLRSWSGSQPSTQSRL